MYGIELETLKSLNLIIKRITNFLDFQNILFVLPAGSNKIIESYDYRKDIVTSETPKLFLEKSLLKDVKYKYIEAKHLKEVKQNPIFYDFIVSGLGFGLREKEFDIDYLIDITNSGLGCCILPTAYLNRNNKNLREIAKSKGLYISTILILPESKLTALELGFFIFSKKESNHEFVLKLETGVNLEFQLNNETLISEICHSQTFDEESLDLDDIDHDEIGKNNTQIINEHSDFFQGMCFKIGEFKNIEYNEYESEIKRLTSDYKNYKSYLLGELCEQINLTKTEFFPKDNQIFIPMIGNQNVTIEEDQLNLQIQNYCQVILKPDKIINTYAKTYLNSVIGRKFLELPLKTKNIIPRLTKKDIFDLRIAVPDIDTQKVVSKTDTKLSAVLENIRQIKGNLSVNPITSKEDIKRIDDIYDIAFVSNSIVRLRGYLRKGESATLEYKQTFSYDQKTKIINKVLELQITKTIAAFLNSEKGGTLLIGVDDNSEISGMNEEIKKLYKNSHDKFKLKFSDMIKYKIGEQFNNNIEYEFITDKQGDVFEVICSPSEKPVYVGVDFYLRSNPRTTKLEGKVLFDYLEQRFLK